MSLPKRIDELDTTSQASVSLSAGAAVAVVTGGKTIQTTMDQFGALGSFLQSGTGAVARTFQDKDRDIVSVKDFGAKGDGVTDDTAAIQAAINSLSSNGGTVLFPGASIYICASGITLDDKVGIVLKGQGSTSGGSLSTSFLKFTGTGTCISARSTNGFICSQLSIQANNAGNTGHLIDLSHSVGLGTDSQLWSVDHCMFFGSSATGTMLSCINTERAIIGVIRECFFTTCPIGILGRATNSAFYCNAIQVLSCTFANIGTMPIRNPGQAWLIQGNTFEQLSNGNVGAVDFQNAVPFSCAGLDIIGNWFGDGNATGTWLSLFGDGIVVSGNYISTGATGISTPGASGLSGCTITGNHFDTVTTAVNTAFAGCSNIFYFGNFFNVVSNVISNAGNITFGLYQDSTGNVIIVGGTKAATSFQVGTPTGGAVANSVNVQGGVYLNNSLLLGAKDTSISTGVGVIHMKSANPATNAAWIPITSADGTVYFVPGWTTNNP